jgi:hypothetical protein
VTVEHVVIASLSGAMDGGFTAIADVSRAMAGIGAADEYRLIGGVAVMLHIQRLRIDLPLRATGDAVDLLVPSYRSRARHTLKVGDVVTTEVPGLAEALRRPGVTIDAELRRTDGAVLKTTVVLPDAVGTLALKARVRSVRNETRDAEDLWRCLEIAAADGVAPAMFDDDEPLEELRGILWRELGPDGHSLPAVVRDLQEAPAARLRTRLRALLAEVVGVVGPGDPPRPP